jgi:hypothetical protein
MSRKTVVEAGAVIFTLGILASPAGAEPLKLADAQMDNLTAGAFASVSGTPTAGTPFFINGSLGGANLTLQSTDGGVNYTASDGSNWVAQALYILGGNAVGVLLNQQTQQFWDGEFLPPPGGIVNPTITRGVLILTPIG